MLAYHPVLMEQPPTELLLCVLLGEMAWLDRERLEKMADAWKLLAQGRKRRIQNLLEIMGVRVWWCLRLKWVVVGVLKAFDLFDC